MFNKSLFYRDTKKLALRAIIVFVSFYSVYATAVVYINFNYFLIFAPIVVVCIYLLGKKLLLEINVDENNINIEFVFLQFILIKKRQTFLIKDISYSYQLELTSRLAENYVFRVFSNDTMIFSRYHDIDGMNQSDVEDIIHEFKLLRINEVFYK